jgi:hypothetical protein
MLLIDHRSRPFLHIFPPSLADHIYTLFHLGRLEGAGFFPSKNTTVINVLPAVFRAIAPKPNTRHEASTAT